MSHSTSLTATMPSFQGEMERKTEKEGRIDQKKTRERERERERGSETGGGVVGVSPVITNIVIRACLPRPPGQDCVRIIAAAFHGQGNPLTRGAQCQFPTGDPTESSHNPLLALFITLRHRQQRARRRGDLW